MFGKKKVEEPVIQQPVEKKEPEFVPSKVTTIAKDVTLVGDFVTQDTIELKGTVRGNIISGAKVHVAQGGMLQGSAKATDITVDGTVDGNVTISNTSEISDTGSLEGSLETKTFITCNGSHFDGKLKIVPERMTSEEKAAEDSSTIQY